MKKFLSLLIIAATLATTTHAMNNNNHQVSLSFSDGTQISIPQEIAEQSITIRQMIEDLQTNDLVFDDCNIPPETFHTIFSHLQNPTIMQSLDLQELSEFILGCNFLDIPDLLSNAMDEYAQRYSKDQYDENFQDQPQFPEEIDDAITQAMIRNNGINTWLLSNDPINQKIVCARGVCERDYYSVCFSPDGHTLALGCHSGNIELLDLQKDTLSDLIAPNSNSAYSLSFSPDGTKLAVGHLTNHDDSCIKIWDLATCSCIKKLPDTHHNVLSICFSPDGLTLASTSNSATIRLWDIASEIHVTLEGHDAHINSVRFSPDGQLIASGDNNGIIKIWDVANRECLATLEGHTQAVWSLDFSPDGNILASGSHDGTIKLWDTQDYSLVGTLHGHAIDTPCVQYFPDGSQLNSLRKLPAYVRCVRFSPDGSMLASCAWDKAVKLWSIPDGRCLRTLEGHAPNETHNGPTWHVWSLCFSPDGNTLASASSEVLLWDIEPFNNTLSNLHNLKFPHTLLINLVKKYDTDESELTHAYGQALLEIYQHIWQDIADRAGENIIF